MKKYIKMFEEFKSDVNMKSLNERTESETPADEVKSKYGAYIHFLTKSLDSGESLAKAADMTIGQFKTAFRAGAFQNTVLKALVAAIAPDAKVVSEKDSTTGWTNELTGERRSGSAATITFEINGKKVRNVGQFITDAELEKYAKKETKSIFELPVLKALGVSKEEAKKELKENYKQAAKAVETEIKDAVAKVDAGEADIKDEAVKLAKGLGLDWLASKIK